MNPYLLLKRGKEHSIIRRHPWIFAGSVDKIIGEPQAGDMVAIIDADNHWLAEGFYSPKGSIICRLCNWDADYKGIENLARKSIQRAKLRSWLLDSNTNACRLINGEGDDVPGLMVDLYGDGAVVQSSHKGTDELLEMFIPQLVNEFQLSWVQERSDGNIRRSEGLAPKNLAQHGEPPETCVIKQDGIKFIISPSIGQKTGFFLDQRWNHRLIGSIAKGKTALDLFCYSGGFGMYAKNNEAKHVTFVDASQHALDLAKLNWQINGYLHDDADFIRADIFEYLQTQTTSFDLVILDPPSLAKKRQEMDSSIDGYIHLNSTALRKMNPNGMMLSCNCSAHISTEQYRMILIRSSKYSNMPFWVLGYFEHGPDHPVAINHPEGRYLQGWLIQI